MAFIQSIEFVTERREELLKLTQRWTADSMQDGTAQQATLVEDRSAPGRFVMAVTFESADSAAQNSDRPETGAYADEFAALCSDGPSYREFDVVETFSR